MIDNAALAERHRTAPFKLGDERDYHWEALTDGGVTLLQTQTREFAGRVQQEDGLWLIERAYGRFDAQSYFSRDAAAYLLLAHVAETNAKRAASRMAWDNRTCIVQPNAATDPAFKREGYVVVAENAPRHVLDQVETRREALALVAGREDGRTVFLVVSAQEWFDFYHERGASFLAPRPPSGVSVTEALARQG